MYSTSAGASRKFTGTSTRPEPETPKKLVRRRAELCDTTATRPPTGTPSRSRAAAWDAADAAKRSYVQEPSDGAG